MRRSGSSEPPFHTAPIAWSDKSATSEGSFHFWPHSLFHSLSDPIGFQFANSALRKQERETEASVAVTMPLNGPRGSLFLNMAFNRSRQRWAFFSPEVS